MLGGATSGLELSASMNRVSYRFALGAGALILPIVADLICSLLSLSFISDFGAARPGGGPTTSRWDESGDQD